MTEPKPSEHDQQSSSKVPREITSSELFRDERSIVILHSGEQYRLMITRNDKLILQK